MFHDPLTNSNVQGGLNVKVAIINQQNLRNFNPLWLINVCSVPLQTVDDFDLQMRSLLIKKYAGVAQDIMPEGYLEAPLAYDAIWAIALGKKIVNCETPFTLILNVR